MKRFIKVFAVTGLALSVAALTAPKAEAIGGWGIAAAVVGGLAVGSCIGATAAHASAPVYYSYPAPTYAYTTTYAVPAAPATTYVAPAAAPCQAPSPAYVAQAQPVAQQVYVQPQVVAQPVYAAPVVYAAPYPYYYGGYYRPVVRVGFGWGGGHYHGHHR